MLKLSISDMKKDITFLIIGAVFFASALLIPENAEIFAKHATAMQKRTFDSSEYATFFPEKGKQLMLKEIELYPESAKFIAPLVERLCK